MLSPSPRPSLLIEALGIAPAHVVGSSGGARRFVETIAFGPGAWDRLPERTRETFVTNAPTFLDEQQDPEGAGVDLDALGRFARPMLLTRGDQSAPFFPAVVARLARALPHATQHLFAGAGHTPHLSHPDAYVDVVGGFVAGVEAARPALTGAPRAG